MDWVVRVLKAAGSVVDVAVPLKVGERTKVSAIVAVAAPVLGKVACVVYPPACPVVDALGQAAAALVPVFAGAGFVRGL